MSERKGTKGLELWCKRLVRDCPEVQIDNMTTSWRNGIAFCALVHHFRPDLIDMSTLKPENIYENNQLAFNIAEKHLGIPSLLDPEDMVENDVPDRLSILTYLSQFYQRLSHTVNTKVSESESKLPISKTAALTEAPTIIRFGKTGLDKCTACGLPVYLAQRLIVSHKLYHRRCFRCSKCSGYINPKNYDITDGSEFSCDSCKNEKTLSKYLNNNDHDQMGMLAFSDQLKDPKETITKLKTRPQSILDKINLFENIEKDSSIDNKMTTLSLKDTIEQKRLSNTSDIYNEVDIKIPTYSKNFESDYLQSNGKETIYKSNIDKFNFLQTQLTGDEDKLDAINIPKDKEVLDVKHDKEDCLNDAANLVKVEETDSISINEKDSNITDDSRIAKTQNIANVDVLPKEQISNNEQDIVISVPPRRKKQQVAEKVLAPVEKPQIIVTKPETKVYPDNLNPFSDDDDEPLDTSKETKRVSTNPFGSSDEEDDQVPPIQTLPKPQANEPTPVRRLIAVNPFWSDGEEPSSDEESTDNSSKMYKSPITCSTPNLLASTPRRKKTKAPAPPVITVSENSRLEQGSVSMDDVASISSLSSFNSTINSENKSHERSTPLSKRRPAPTPPDSLSTMSGCEGSIEHGVDTTGTLGHNSSLGTRRTKGPAPGLPLPERREVKLQMSPEQLQVQLDLLETQQLGLERQGVLIEKMIRDKCEGDEASSVPQEEVEDLVIQLCELVNEKNDLFRKQTELMYIRRQQRLEQEQADIEHEIRVLQSKPAVNRIDAEKAREEVLVSRLVEIVRMRDELVQQIDTERRRERQEDLAIAASIANKRAQRNSESNSSSMKSVEVVTPKKSKVKDKVKKQFKKVKHSVISKKKDDTAERKDGKHDNEKKSK